MSIEDDRQISRFVPDRLPEFVRVDHPTLVAFLEAYYEWLGLRRNSGVVVSPMAMHDIPDVDHTLDQFIEQFKKQYLFNFPETLAFNKDTNEPVDARRLIKNIKQFYLAKGTEKSYEFLFRIFYDTNVEFYYPKKDILRLSSGRWIQNNYLRISNDLGDQIYQSEGNLIVQRDARGEVVASARVVSVNVLQIDTFPVAELLISNRNGTFQTGDLGIEFQDGETIYKEVRVYSVVSSTNIEEGGSNYRVGEPVRFVSNTGDGGQRGEGIVAEVDALGGVRKISIDDFGINYINPPTIVIDSSRGAGFQGTATVGSLCQSFGYYANNDGRLSTNKVLQDNHYYQNWSYVLKSEVVIDTYRELIRRLVHPVGTGMFGSVLIKRCSKANLDNASALMSFKIPYIGNYVPYTFQTFDDLSVWFMGPTSGGMTAVGYSPTAHDSLIQQDGNRFAVIGNPITNDVGFKEAASGILTTPGFPNADPFWIVYPHPNKHVEHGYHYARVWKPQISDFVKWREWIQNHPSQTNYDEFLRFTSNLSRSEYDDLKASGEIAFLLGGDETQCQCSQAQCDLYGDLCNGTIRLLRDQAFGGGDCCCCDGNFDEGLGIQRCACDGGSFETAGSNSFCVCPHGYQRQPINGGCGWRCVRPGGGPGGGCDCDPECEQCVDGTWCQPICSPFNAGQCPCTNCSPSCPDSCCPDGSCPDPVEGCRPCLDPVYAAANLCECFPDDDECPGNICDKIPTWENCCLDPCAPSCNEYCLNNPNDLRCLRLCIDFPCCTGCSGRECNPTCPQYDPCLTSCPNFDYCATGASDCPEYGRCHPLCPDFDICTSVGCSGYDPCNLICNPNYCDENGPCYDPCVCGEPCAPECSGFDWCKCDYGGETCCANNPCLPVCNPDVCDPLGFCYDRCATGCPAFDPCSTDCPGYGPCHPDCPPVTGDINRRPCNPLCPGFDPCIEECPNYDRLFCCGGCNCGDGGGIGDPIYNDRNSEADRRNRSNPPYNPADNNPCNNDNASCLFGQNTIDPNSSLGTLLKYDESSEFRKITMRAFFNMPAGDAFDCRDETMSFVAIPQFALIEPVNGEQVRTYNPNRPLTVRYRILNQENLGYYKIAQVNLYIDNSLRSTVSINAREIAISNVRDGRRTLKMEMVDFEGNNVPGTQVVAIFGYQYAEESRRRGTTDGGDDSFQTMMSSFNSGDPEVSDIVWQPVFPPTLNRPRREEDLNECIIECDNRSDEDRRRIFDGFWEGSMENQRENAERQSNACARESRDQTDKIHQSWNDGLGGQYTMREIYDRDYRSSPRTKVLYALEGMSYCTARRCGLLSPYGGVTPSGFSDGYGYFPSGTVVPGQNLCLNDHQREIWLRVIDLRRNACIRGCSNPLDPNCPNKDEDLITACRLTALANYRCRVVEIESNLRLISCTILTDAAKCMIACYNKSYGGMTAQELPPSPEFDTCEQECDRRMEDALGVVFDLRAEQYNDAVNKYNQELANCGCPGATYPPPEETLGPTVFPLFPLRGKPGERIPDDFYEWTLRYPTPGREPYQPWRSSPEKDEAFESFVSSDFSTANSQLLPEGLSEQDLALTVNGALNNPQIRELYMRRGLSGESDCCQQAIENFENSPEPIRMGGRNSGVWSRSNPCGYIGQIMTCTRTVRQEIFYTDNPSETYETRETFDSEAERGYNPEFNPPPNWWDVENPAPCEPAFSVRLGGGRSQTTRERCFDVLELNPAGGVLGTPVLRTRRVCVITDIYCDINAIDYYGAGCGCPNGCSCDNPACQGHPNCAGSLSESGPLLPSEPPLSP